MMDEIPAQNPPGQQQVDEEGGHDVRANDEEPVTFFQWVERLSYRFLGNDLTQFVIRRRFVLSRVLIVFVYWTVGIEYYHGEEKWDRIDCAYFITVTTTTVGYGDFHPTTQATQLFTVFYAIFGIAFVLSSVTDLVNYLVVRKMQTRVLTILGVTNMESRAWFKLIFSVCCVLSMITIGTIFFNVNEGWHPATALYWTIITMLTIGYGDLSIGDSSRKFSIWFIWTCVVIYIMAISNIFDTVEELKNAALRKEILRAHRVDILDLLENDRRDRETVTDDRVKYPPAGRNSLAAIYPVTSSSSSSRPGASDEVMYEDSPIESDRRGRSGGDIELGKAGTTMSPLFEKAGQPSNTSLASSLFKTVDDDAAGSQKLRGSFAPPARNSSLLGAEHGFTDPFRRGSDDDPVSTRRLNPAGGTTAKRRGSIFDDPGALQAKSDRFVLEMLVKMKKVDQLRDIDPLVKHFEEIGQMREEHKDASKEVVAKMIIDTLSSNTSTLSSFAATLVGNKKIVVSKRASEIEKTNNHRRESAAEASRDPSKFNPGGRKASGTGSRSGSYLDDQGISPPAPGPPPEVSTSPARPRQKSELQLVNETINEGEDEDEED